jgi:hypothetical protein
MPNDAVLTTKQAKFVAEYLVDGNGARDTGARADPSLEVIVAAI